MKRIIVFLVLLLLSSQTLFGSVINNKLALKLQQAKKIDLIIKRVNTLFEFVNLYILETANIDELDNATFSQNMAHLKAKYGNLQSESFLKGQELEFKVNSTVTTAHNGATLYLAKTVTFSNIVPNSLPAMVKQLYVNSINLHPQAIVNADLSMTFILNSETIQFINYTNMMKQLNLSNMAKTVIGMPTISPTCNGTPEEGNVWYQPNGKGGYYMSVCQNHAVGGFFYDYLSDKIDVALVRPTQNDLTNIQPISGTIGYWINGAQMKQMIYVDNNGTIGLNGWVDIP